MDRRRRVADETGAVFKASRTVPVRLQLLGYSTVTHDDTRDSGGVICTDKNAAATGLASAIRTREWQCEVVRVTRIHKTKRVKPRWCCQMECQYRSVGSLLSRCILLVLSHLLSI